MAGLTLFTMFSFIVLGTMFQCVQMGNRGGSVSQPPVAKTQKFGNLDMATFANQSEGLFRLSRFLELSVARLVEDKALFSYDGSTLFFIEPDPVSPTDSSKSKISLAYDLMMLLQQIQYTLANSENLVDRWLVIETGKARKINVNEDSVR
ncbi:MAG: hypothetical protein IKW74_02785, partial [Thermoguttaceae bacterium]|nr:hypothetical protein [Thermoguttaceae bacterium]